MSARAVWQAFRDNPLRQRRVWMPVCAILLAVHLPFLHAALRGAPEAVVTVPLRDDFDRTALGDAWWSNGGLWRIVSGELYSPGVGNNPLWLKARLPRDVRIAFDVRSEAATGDIKWEAFGDGRNHSTGYVFIFGGWNNRESRIAKLDEHAFTVEEIRAQLSQIAHPFPSASGGLDGLVDYLRTPISALGARRALDQLAAGRFFERDTPVVVKRTDVKVVKGKRYHMTVTRKGTLLRWDVDGQLMLQMDDRAPLEGPGHDRFGFSSWANDTWFDNLVIEAM
jgi:hypothetical protein